MNWVSYELTRQETKGKEKRSDNFIADPLVKGTIATNAVMHVRDMTKDTWHLLPT